MVFTTNNNIRFRDNNDFSLVGDFIAGKDKHVSVFLAGDLVLSFNDGKYEGIYKLPF